jgi:O-antigen ligase
VTALPLRHPRTAAVAVGGAAVCIVGAYAATISPKGVIYAVGGCLLLVLAAQSLVWLLAAFIVLTFPEQLPFGIAAGTVAKPLGALLVGAWLLHLLEERGEALRGRVPTPLAATLTAFVAFAAASALWATGGSAVLSDFSRLAQMAMLFVIVVTAARTRRDVLILAGAYILAATVTGTYALASGTTLAGRLTGGIANSNFLAAALAAGILLAFFALLAARAALLRIALAASIVVNGVAFTMTQSRGGVVALAAGIVFAVVLAGRWRPQATAAGMLAGAVGATYFFALAAPAIRDRLTNISAQGSSGRSDEWQIAYRIFAHHPIGGAGLGNYSLLAPHYATDTLQLLRVQYVLRGFVAHNTYLQILSELGLVGAALFAVLLLVVVGSAVKTVFEGRLELDPTASAIARGAIVALLAILVAYAFGSALFQKQLWVLLGLVAAIPVLAARDFRADASR